MAPMKLTSFFITAEQAAGLKVLKARHGTPEGESTRRALTAYLRKQGALKAPRTSVKSRKGRRA